MTTPRPTLPALLAVKRDGLVWAEGEIDWLVRAITEGHADACQVGAFAMLVRLRGMDMEETIALTRAMANSGQHLHWPEGPPLVDKHSTGGVGDCTSLVVAPLLAACGARVPMVSGRGLGHTGGTLDKLEAIPGYDCRPDAARRAAVLQAAGCIIVGADAGLAPADRILYAVRDVTATVDSIPLIVASILSKKLAAGVDTLVLDVKQGNGAILPDPNEAANLASALAMIGTGLGLRMAVLRTGMDQPLATAAGNALEVRAALDILRGADPHSRLHTLCLRLAAEGLVASGLATDLDTALRNCREALADGRAAECFARMVHGLGGPADLLDRPGHHLLEAPHQQPVPAGTPGWVAGWDTRALGELVVDLGGGRRRQGDSVDSRVGLSALPPIGTWIEADQPIARIHAATAEAATAARSRVRAALKLATNPVDPPLLVIGSDA